MSPQTCYLSCYNNWFLTKAAMMNCVWSASRRKCHIPEGLCLLLGAMNGSGVAKLIANNRYSESKENQKMCLTKQTNKQPAFGSGIICSLFYGRISVLLFIFAGSFTTLILLPRSNSPQWARASSLYKLHDHIQTQSVGVLWTSDQFVTEPSTWQHATLKRDIYAPSGIRNCKLAVVDPRLTPHGHWG